MRLTPAQRRVVTALECGKWIAGKERVQHPGAWKDPTPAKHPIRYRFVTTSGHPFPIHAKVLNSLRAKNLVALVPAYGYSEG